MKRQQADIRQCGKMRQSVHFAVVAMFAVGLSGCAAMPHWANPVEWYKDARGVFTEDTATEEARKRSRATERTSPGAGEPYPNLASVPERPQDFPERTDRSRIQDGLVADREMARHAPLASPGGARTETLDPVPGAPPVPEITPPPEPRAAAVPARPIVPESPQTAPEPPAQTVEPEPSAPSAAPGPERMEESAPSSEDRTAALPTLPAERADRVAPPTGRAERVTFEAGSASLPDAAEELLRTVARDMEQDSSLRLQLEAYAAGDANSESESRRLSLNRALNIRSFLIKEGIGATRIDVRALGSTAPSGESDRVDLNLSPR